MIQKSPAFQFYPKDFLSDRNVMAMTLEERGAYITLLSVCWLEGSIPSELPRLARMLGVTEKALGRMWSALCPCFVEGPSGFVHPRLEKEREKQAKWREKSIQGGKRGSEKRWAKDRGGDRGGHEMVVTNQSPTDDIAVSSLQTTSTDIAVSNETGEAPELKDNPEGEFCILIRKHFWLGKEPPALLRTKYPGWTMGREITIGKQWAKDYGGWSNVLGMMPLFRKVLDIDDDQPLSCVFFNAKDARHKINQVLGHYQRLQEKSASSFRLKVGT